MMDNGTSLQVEWVFWFLILAIFIGVIIRGMYQKNRNSRQDNAMETLRKRYAKGEINDEEFKHMKKELDE